MSIPQSLQVCISRLKARTCYGLLLKIFNFVGRWTRDNNKKRSNLSTNFKFNLEANYGNGKFALAISVKNDKSSFNFFLNLLYRRHATSCKR